LGYSKRCNKKKIAKVKEEEDEEKRAWKGDLQGLEKGKKKQIFKMVRWNYDQWGGHPNTGC